MLYTYINIKIHALTMYHIYDMWLQEGKEIDLKQKTSHLSLKMSFWGRLGGSVN